MFLATLTDEMKDAFLALAANVVPPSDSGLYHSRLWDEWLAEMRLPERSRIAWDDVHVAAGQIGSRPHKVSAMLELARLTVQAAAEPEAEATFARIGGVLGFSADEIEEFAGWARRHTALVAEAACYRDAV